MSTVQSYNTWKQLATCRVVAISNQSGTFYNGPTNNGVGATFTYATGALTIDGVTLVVGDRVLFQNQTSAYLNGIWQVIVAGATGVSAVLQRAGDLQCIEQIKGGQYTMISAGSDWAGSTWVVVEPYPAAMGVPNVSGANNVNFKSVQGNLVSGIYIFAGGGVTATVTVPGMTASSVVTATFAAKANASNILTVLQGAGSFVITVSADPGSSVFNWVATL